MKDTGLHTLYHIPVNEVAFHPHSFGDRHGRLFRWQGEVYRGISASWAPVLRRLLQDGILDNLVKRGLLIETELTPWHLDGYDLVLRHRAVPHVSYPNEWCAEMLKQAALTIIDLAAELAEYGLALQDAHPWNVVFDGTVPVYVDLTSIVPIAGNAQWPATDEFCRYCLHPLLLMSRGHDNVARCLLPTYEGVSLNEVRLLTRPVDLLGETRWMIQRLIAGVRRRVPALRKVDGGRPSQLVDGLRRLRAEVETIPLPRQGRDEAGLPLAFGSLVGRDVSASNGGDPLGDLLGEIKPSSVLTLDADGGWCAVVAASSGARVVSFNTDLDEAGCLYSMAHANGLPILPLIMDFTHATPSAGLGSHWSIAASERLRCEMVVAMNLVRDLIMRRHLNFQQIVEGLADFSTRWAVVEFVPAEERELGRGGASLPSWYTLPELQSALEKRFRHLRVVRSHRPTRSLVICEK